MLLVVYDYPQSGTDIFGTGLYSSFHKLLQPASMTIEVALLYRW